MALEDCLPEELRGSTTTITRIAAGLSGAGVYRVDAGDRAFVLKIAHEGEPLADWRRKLHIQQLAAGAGVAPAIVHADEERRAVVSTLVVDRSFPALYRNPATRARALELLGRTLRRVHDLPPPLDATAIDPRERLAWLESDLTGSFAVPVFASDAIRRVLAEEPPAHDRALVLSHNDVNPSNLAYDGDELLLLDWDTAAPNDFFYDLATISIFARMDDADCLALLAAHDGQPSATLPARFVYDRRLVGVLAGAMGLHTARLVGHAGARGDETLEATPPLAEFYRRMLAGELSLATGDGRWWFGLALIKAGLAV